jgi:NADPH:quinone reductase-like Zn-dependent oxidoreductase
VVPAAFSLEEAACIPTAYLTAWHALIEVGRLAPGEAVLINAAGGGVSSAAIQLAKKMGATVLATGRSDRQLSHAERLGADHLLNHQSASITEWARRVTGGRGVDMVFDHLGPALWTASLATAAPKRRECGATSGPRVTLELGQLHLLGLQVLGSDAYWHEEFSGCWRSTGGAASRSSTRVPAGRADQAHRRMEGELAGKILLKP